MKAFNLHVGEGGGTKKRVMHRKKRGDMEKKQARKRTIKKFELQAAHVTIKTCSVLNTQGCTHRDIFTTTFNTWCHMCCLISAQRELVVSPERVNSVESRSGHRACVHVTC